MSIFVGKYGQQDLIRIDDDGQIWDARTNERVPNDRVIEHFHLYARSHGTTRIGGGKMMVVGCRGFELRRHTEPDGRIWWDVPGNLCNLKDIDEARKVRRELESQNGAAASPPRAASRTEGR